MDDEQEQIDAFSQVSATSNQSLAAQTYKAAKAIGVKLQLSSNKFDSGF